MNYDMVKYVIHLSKCKYMDTLEIHSKECRISLFDISMKMTLVINDTRIDISDYTFMKFDLDCDFQDEVLFEFYTYEDFGDAGMDLVYQTHITTKLSTLDLFQIL